MTHQQTRISKTISYALRHRPDEFGLNLDAEGWVSIKDLIKAASSNLGFAISQQDIEEIIARSEKKRFEISGDRIRATYKIASGRATMLQRVGESEQKNFDPMASI